VNELPKVRSWELTQRGFKPRSEFMFLAFIVYCCSHPLFPFESFSFLFCQLRWLMPVIPATQEVEFWRVMVQGQPMQKVNKISSQQKNWTWWHLSVISATQEV
jgi:hypothetical protein